MTRVEHSSVGRPVASEHSSAPVVGLYYWQERALGSVGSKIVGWDFGPKRAEVRVHITPPKGGGNMNPKTTGAGRGGSEELTRE